MQPHMLRRPRTTQCVISQMGRQGTLEATFTRARHAIHPGSGPAPGVSRFPNLRLSPGLTARSVAGSRRRTRGNPLAGVRPLGGTPSTCRSLDRAIVKFNEIAEEGVGRRCDRELRWSIRARGGVDVWRRRRPRRRPRGATSSTRGWRPNSGVGHSPGGDLRVSHPLVSDEGGGTYGALDGSSSTSTRANRGARTAA